MAGDSMRSRNWNPRPKGLKRLALAFIGMVVANFLASTRGPGFPKTNEELSELNPTYLTPDGVTFAVWGPIYLFELLGLLEMAAGCGNYYLPRREAALSWLAFAFVLNAAWLVAFAQEAYALSLLMMMCYLLTLVRSYVDIDVLHDTDIFLPVAVSMNLAWVCVATCLNAVITCARIAPPSLLAQLGFFVPDDPPSSGFALEQPAGTPTLARGATILLVLFALAALHTRRDWAFASTVAWACAGLSRGQRGVEEIHNATTTGLWVCTLGVVVSLLCGCCCPRRYVAPKPARKVVTPRAPQAANSLGPIDHAELKALFERAQKAVRTLKAMDNENLLLLYGLYKRATVGLPTKPRPSSFDPVGRAKHDAWAKLEDMDAVTAMRRYCEAVDNFVPGWR